MQRFVHPVTGLRIGAQRPRLESVPSFVTTAAEDAIDLIALAGKTLDEWQSHVLEGALGERSDGRWTAFEVGLIVPRQNGKNVIVEARELAGMYLFGEQTIIHSAHQFKTARKSFKDMERMIRTTPYLYQQVLGWKPELGTWDEVKGIRTSAAELSIELANGAKLEYQARSSGGGRGFTGDLIVLDEAYDLTTDEIAAMMPTMAARSMDGNPQIWYTSSAGMPRSYALADLRKRGMDGDSPRLAYYEWSAEDDADSDDVEAWYQANPGLGIRIAEDYVRDTELEGMDDEKFRRERLGIWAKIGGNKAFTPSQWKTLCDVESLPGDVVSFAVDVPPSRDSATISVASLRGDGLIHVEDIDRRVGTSWVPARLKELQDSWRPIAIVIDAGSTAGSLIPEIRRSGVRVLEVTGRQYMQACGLFMDAVKDKTLRHIGQDELREAVEAVTKKFVSESLFKWVRGTTEDDISPVVAVTLALLGLDLKKPRNGMTPGGKRSSGWKVVAL